MKKKLKDIGWDARSHQATSNTLHHTRPLSQYTISYCTTLQKHLITSHHTTSTTLHHTILYLTRPNQSAYHAKSITLYHIKLHHTILYLTKLKHTKPHYTTSTTLHNILPNHTATHDTKLRYSKQKSVHSLGIASGASVLVKLPSEAMAGVVTWPGSSGMLVAFLSPGGLVSFVEPVELSRLTEGVGGTRVGALTSAVGPG